MVFVFVFVLFVCFVFFVVKLSLNTTLRASARVNILGKQKIPEGIPPGSIL